ncbi:MAG: aldehyde dehydrogenase family protein [Acidobacteriota bacterium]|nr:aldehyde dehydrogenase family protein [Blastocatellia bacterium]MDW8413558.1 aldehyde dehydrogenase family protein [Acidobacteriota bacterium]
MSTIVVEQQQQRRYIENICPITGEVIGRVAIATPQEVTAAVAKARKALPNWTALPISERTKYILAIRDLFVERRDHVLDTIRKDTGKTRTDALLADVFTLVDALTFFCKHAEKTLAPKELPLHFFKTKKSLLYYEPLGVVGVITPWNFPTAFLTDVALALLAGNCVILKPSEVTPLIGELTAELFAAAGLPESVFQVILGDGTTGAALVASDIDKLVFTGSVRTGKMIYRELANKDKFTPVALELGGKDPMIVLEDADLERAAEAAVWGGLVNSGQMCSSVERVYVIDSVADKFTNLVVNKVKTLRQSSDDGPEVDIGAIIFPKQLEIIEEHVQDAIAKGAKVLTGGSRNTDLLPGYYYKPTVLVDVDHTMKVMTEETFGPVIPIMKVRDEEEAIRLANDSRYGLTASIWSQNTERAKRLALRIEAGTVAINDCGATGFGLCEAPWFGVKDSGFGFVHSLEGLKNFCKIKHLIVDRGLLKREFYWFPNGAKSYRLLLTMFDMLFAKGSKKLQAIFRKGV